MRGEKKGGRRERKREREGMRGRKGEEGSWYMYMHNC